MAIRDDIKKEQEKLKGKPFKDKLEYFIDYYKWHVIVLVALIAIIGGTIYQKATTAEVKLTGVLFNASDLLAAEELQQIVDDFSAGQGWDPQKETIRLHTNLSYSDAEGVTVNNYESMEVLATWVLAGEVDFIIGDASLMTQLVEGGYIQELPAGIEGWVEISPCLLDVSSSGVLQSIYGSLGEDLALGIAVSAENTEGVLAFIDYLKS